MNVNNNINKENNIVVEFSDAELDAICERDHQLKMILSQGDDIPDILNKTRNDIDNALNNLEIGLTIQK